LSVLIVDEAPTILSGTIVPLDLLPKSDGWPQFGLLKHANLLATLRRQIRLKVDNGQEMENGMVFPLGNGGHLRNLLADPLGMISMVFFFAIIGYVRKTNKRLQRTRLSAAFIER
jgi:hypothetical protein